MGVQLFFIISGFLLGKTFYNKENVNVLDYYKKRAIAILPLYYFIIIYFYFTENIFNQYSNVIPNDEMEIGWFRYIFLLNGIINSKTSFWSNLGGTWTIPVFCYFYLIAPWIVRKMNSLFSIITMWLVVFICSNLFDRFYSCTVLSYISILFLGVVIYVCVYERMYKKTIIIFLIVSIWASIIGNEMYMYTFILATIMTITISIEDIHILPKVYRFICVIDEYSYTLYLVHCALFCSILDRMNYAGVSKIYVGFIGVFGTVILTFFIGKYIEKPIQNFLRRKCLKK